MFLLRTVLPNTSMLLPFDSLFFDESSFSLCVSLFLSALVTGRIEGSAFILLVVASFLRLELSFFGFLGVELLLSSWSLTSPRFLRFGDLANAGVVPLCESGVFLMVKAILLDVVVLLSSLSLSSSCRHRCR